MADWTPRRSLPLTRVDAWARRQAAAARATEAGIVFVTVRKAVEAYVAGRKARQAKAGRDAELRLRHHVLAAPVADRALLDPTDADLAAWRDGLRRGGRGKPRKAPLAPATLARLLNDLRAALTAAARRVKALADLHTVTKDGLRAPENFSRARAMQILNNGDVRKLIEAVLAQDAEFGVLVMTLAATGARFDQVAPITVGDFQPDARRIMVPGSRKGQGQKRVTHTAVPLQDDVIAWLRSLAAGRAAHDSLLLRLHHHQVAGNRTISTLPRWEPIERRP